MVKYPYVSHGLSFRATPALNQAILHAPGVQSQPFGEVPWRSARGLSTVKATHILEKSELSRNGGTAIWMLILIVGARFDIVLEVNMIVGVDNWEVSGYG